MTNLKQYYQMLKDHDWYYEYADDIAVWRKGLDSEAKLVELSELSTEHQRLYDGFKVYHNNVVITGNHAKELLPTESQE